MNSRSISLIGTTILVSSICLGLVSPLPVAGSSRLAVGETITVNTMLDEYNTGPDDCSLREAIRAANLNGPFGGCSRNSNPGDDTIVLSDLPGSPDIFLLTRTGAYDNSNMSGDLDVDGNLTISGAGQDATIISAVGLGDRIIEVLNGFTLSMDHLTLTGGRAPDGTAGSLGVQGTYGQYGGAILSGTTTSLDSVTCHNRSKPVRQWWCWRIR